MLDAALLDVVGTEDREEELNVMGFEELLNTDALDEALDATGGFFFASPGGCFPIARAVMSISGMRFVCKAGTMVNVRMATDPTKMVERMVIKLMGEGA